MAPSISQIFAVSYPAVLNRMRKATNQWAESAFMRELERQKAVVRSSFGPTLEKTLDYQRNTGTDFLADDLTDSPGSLTKTEVLTAASIEPGQLSVPIVWSKGDEARNPSENQKIKLVSSLTENAITSHDDAIEEALFGTVTDGFYGMRRVVPDDGDGTFEGIDAGTDVWWRNVTGSYDADGSDIEAQLTAAWNSAAKGSGSSLAPTLLVSGATAQAIFEGSQQAFQRYIDTDELKAGFKVLGFKTARYVFSQYGGVRIYGLNPKSFTLEVCKDAFRQKGDTIEIPQKNGYVVKIYSMLQTMTDNKSRLFVLNEANSST
jgi:hypothetical protein